jgi:HamA
MSANAVDVDMTVFDSWCDETRTSVKVHLISVLEERPADREVGLAAVATRVPFHYFSEERIAHHLARLGKVATANLIQGALPTLKTARSGDLGEILATEYIAEKTDYQIPIKKLRWKDHRQMAMRGDDVIGLRQDPQSGRLQFLKAEVKSRATLAFDVLEEARAGLDRDGGLPSNHALGFISSRLFESGNTALADAIDNAQLKNGVSPPVVRHLIFTFSGNAPQGLLQKLIYSYSGAIVQLAVGLRVGSHGKFVGNVYELVAKNALND